MRRIAWSLATWTRLRRLRISGCRGLATAISLPKIFETKTYHFVPNFQVLRRVPGKYTIAEMEKEVGMYSATPEFVRKHGGAIANRFLDQVPTEYFAALDRAKLWPNLDIRIHRLYPGDYPAYPGWHCDGELRETYFGQPNLDLTPASFGGCDQVD